ncbi:MAG: hypothetical protein IJG87_06570 [Ruminococcus sp.]|nr:hypothetical protein [Ruminococcus sp.]
MRDLVERAAVLTELCRGCSLHSNKPDYFCGEPCPKYERLSAIPTTDARPMAHGEWIAHKFILYDGEPGYAIECSVCGEVFTEVSVREVPTKVNYCPKCGANMQGLQI